MATATMPAEQRFRLSDISLPTYLAYSDGLGPRHVPVTYDQGEMELMTLSFEHEAAKHLLGLLIAALAEEVYAIYWLTARRLRLPAFRGEGV